MKFKNDSEPRVFPHLGPDGTELRVGPGEEFEATGQDGKNLEAAGFDRTDKPSKTSEKE